MKNIKKLSAIFCSIFLISNSSYADGFFVGTDLLNSNIRTNTNDNYTLFGLGSNSGVDNNRIGYGVNAGFRGDISFLMGSAELFYDNLNIDAGSLSSVTNSSDRTKIEDRYGVKVNIGMKVAPLVTPFVTAGLVHLNYKSSNNAGNVDSNSEFAPLYGVGILVDLPKNITIKAAYDYQQFNNHVPSGAKIHNHLNVVRIGLIYNF